METPASVLTALIGSQQAEHALSALSNAGFVCVPRVPTPTMIDEAWADALAEDAAGVWGTMIDEWELAVAR